MRVCGQWTVSGQGERVARGEVAIVNSAVSGEGAVGNPIARGISSW